MSIAIQPASRDEVDRLAAIHADSLAEDFLPSLGRDFLARQYYPAALASPNAVTLVANEGTMPVGFATVASDSDAFSHDVLRGHLCPIAGYALRRALRQPGHLLLSAQVLLSALRPRPCPWTGEIVFIAVAEEFRGRGVGRRLIQAAVDHLARRAVARCRTKTLARNHSVIRLYAGLGWEVVDRYWLIGREYVVLLSPEARIDGDEVLSC
jgi:ribosomal protein S18 acetylase RimI-like enzyme